jgi:hypothetical protein
MANALALPAAVLPALLAAMALTAGIGQQADHSIPRIYSPYPGSRLNYNTGNFVAQDYSRPDAPPQHPGHHQQVVVAESTGLHLNQRLSLPRGWGRNLPHGQ